MRERWVDCCVVVKLPTSSTELWLLLKWSYTTSRRPISTVTKHHRLIYRPYCFNCQLIYWLSFWLNYQSFRIQNVILMSPDHYVFYVMYIYLFISLLFLIAFVHYCWLTLSLTFGHNPHFYICTVYSAIFYLSYPILSYCHFILFCHFYFIVVTLSYSFIWLVLLLCV